MKRQSLALICLAVLAAARSSAASQEPVHQKQESAVALHAQSQNTQKLSQYTDRQRASLQQIEATEVELKLNISRLEQLRSRYPNSPDLERTISQLQNQLTQLQQQSTQLQQEQAAQASRLAKSRVVDDAALASVAAQTQRMQQISAATLSNAQQANKMANVTIDNLNRASAAPPPPPPPPVEVPKTQPDTGPPPATITPAETTQPPPTQPPVIHLSPAPVASGSDETEWFNKLKNGLLQYSVPDTMLWKVASTVTVQISGEKTPAPSPIDQQTGQAPIKVARRMKVLVSAPDNPDEFVITPEADTQLEQYVPEDGPTTWHFSVTPTYTAKAQKLVVQAWVIYDANTQQELPVYKQAVNVRVPSLWECIKRLLEGDPDYWAKYWLPGGAGFVFFSGIVVGIWKWLKKKKTRGPQPVG